MQDGHGTKLWRVNIKRLSRWAGSDCNRYWNTWLGGANVYIFAMHGIWIIGLLKLKMHINIVWQNLYLPVHSFTTSLIVAKISYLSFGLANDDIFFFDRSFKKREVYLHAT